MGHTCYFYLTIFVKKKRYFYSVTFDYVLLVTFIFTHLYSEREHSEREVQQ